MEIQRLGRLHKVPGEEARKKSPDNTKRVLMTKEPY
jgi:hypothetical protein